jgi:hypothetical protein
MVVGMPDCQLKELPLACRAELTAEVISHFIGVNQIDVSKDEFSDFFLEMYNRAYALHVTAGALQGWEASGPCGRKLTVNDPRSIVDCYAFLDQRCKERQ